MILCVKEGDQITYLRVHIHTCRAASLTVRKRPLQTEIMFHKEYARLIYFFPLLLLLTSRCCMFMFMLFPLRDQKERENK